MVEQMSHMFKPRWADEVRSLCWLFACVCGVVRCRGGWGDVVLCRLFVCVLSYGWWCGAGGGLVWCGAVQGEVCGCGALSVVCVCARVRACVVEPDSTNAIHQPNPHSNPNPTTVT
jgi:hypothetical protein